MVSGRGERVSPLVRRLVAGNAGPFTFTGTCTYLVGEGRVAVIDPGPDDPAHLAALLDALEGGSVSHIMVTHTHRDHSPNARALARITGAPVVGCAPHRRARQLAEGETAALDASVDQDHRPDRVLDEGDAVEGWGWRLEAVPTPGHTANHLAFALPQERALFSGDHVMAWSTSVIAPPDGAMGPYLASLERVLARDDAVYWPGHGGPVREPGRFVRALIRHRRAREAAILAGLAAGDRTIPEIVGAVYPDLAPALSAAAGLSVLAHLEDLIERGRVTAGRGTGLGAEYRPA